MKYYWLAYQYNAAYCTFSGLLREEVCTIHPFTYINNMRKNNKYGFYALANWKPISKEEYDLFKKENK